MRYLPGTRQKVINHLVECGRQLIERDYNKGILMTHIIDEISSGENKNTIKEFIVKAD